MKFLRHILLVLLFSAGTSFALSAQQEVTNGLVRKYSIDLTKVIAPNGVKSIHWEITRKDGAVLEPTIISTFPDAATTNHSIDILWDGTVGDTYVLTASLEDNNSCFSEAVSQEIIILPSDGDFMFADAIDVLACSFNGVAETKSLNVTYAGVKPWKLHYRIKDKDGVVRDNLVAKDSDGNEIEFANSTAIFDIEIDNFFINNDNSDQNWIVELIKAVSVADGNETLVKGVNPTKNITVHPLPVINGGITLN